MASKTKKKVPMRSVKKAATKVKASVTKPKASSRPKRAASVKVRAKAERVNARETVDMRILCRDCGDESRSA